MKDASEGRTSLAANHSLVLVCLVCFGVIGTTYYFLDSRKEPYQIQWIVASASWYGMIGFSLVKVFAKARIGYLVSGILFWTTFAIWMLDNWYTVFHGTILAAMPDHTMTVRNFIGAGIAALGIISSHNAFNKTKSKIRPV